MAMLTSISDVGSAYFSIAGVPTMTLPADTYFPMRHLNAIIDGAEEGEKILAASVFTGADPDDALLATNTVIGGWKIEAPAARLGAFGQKGYWPVQTAYFKPTAKLLSLNTKSIIQYSPMGSFAVTLLIMVILLSLPS